MIRCLASTLVLLVIATGSASAQPYRGQNFNPDSCVEPYKGKVSVDVGGVVYDIPEGAFDGVVPSEFTMTGGSGKDATMEPRAENELCPDNPMKSHIAVARADWSDGQIRFTLRENKTRNRIPRRAEMLDRIRAEVQCELVDQFLLCSVTENNGRDDILYALPPGGARYLQSGQSLHVRCEVLGSSEGQIRCAVTDITAETVDVELATPGIGTNIGWDGYAEIIEMLNALARGWQRK